MNAARCKIENLSAALRENPVEIYEKYNQKNSDTFLQLKSEMDDLAQHKDFLETFISHKTTDYFDSFVHLLLINMNKLLGLRYVGSGGKVVELESLRYQNSAAMSTELDSEILRTMESSLRIPC